MAFVFKPQKSRKQGYQTKLLPYTPYVSSWPYRTDIFSITRWQDRPKTDTWLQEVEEWKKQHHSLPQDISELLDNVARLVDELEHELHTKYTLQKQCGFHRNGRAVPLAKVSVRFFLPTHLLDVLLWSAFDDTDPTSRSLTFNPHHPELALGEPWHPKSSRISYRYVDYSGDRMNELTTQFLELFHSTFPTFLPAGHIPRATLTTVDLESSETSEALKEEEHPSKWKDSQSFLAHATTAANAMNSKAVADASIVSCNLWVLISSLIFLIKCQDEEYGERFSQAHRFMMMDSRTREMLEWYFRDRDQEEPQNTANEVEGEEDKVDDDDEEEEEEEEEPKEAGVEQQGTGKGNGRETSKEAHFASERLVLATAALCHSPMFVLNPSVDLSKQKDRKMVPYKELSLKNVISSSFDPLPTNTRATACEKTLWKLIAKTMSESLASKAIGGPMTGPQGNLGTEMPQLLHTVLSQELKISNTVESLTQKVVRLDWPHSLNEHPQTTEGQTNAPQAVVVVRSVADIPFARRSSRELTPKRISIQTTHSPRRKARSRRLGATRPTTHTLSPVSKEGESNDQPSEDESEDQGLSRGEVTGEVGSPLRNPVEIERKDDMSVDSSWGPNHEGGGTSLPRAKAGGIEVLRSPQVAPDSEAEDGSSTATRRERVRLGKRKQVHFESESDQEDQPPSKKPKFERRTDTTYRWTTHVDIKLEPADDLPPVSPESPKLAGRKIDFTPTWEEDIIQDIAEELEDDGKISVIRHVLLPDGKFHRETITFTVAWPDNYKQKKYFASLLKNSRPAEVDERYAIIEAPQSTNNSSLPCNPQKSILPLSYFDCLEKRNLDPNDLEELELTLASSPKLIIPPRDREAIREAYTLPILDSDDISKNLLVNVYLVRQVHDVRHLKHNGKMENLRAGSIHQVIQQDRRAMNMLDIPNPNLTLPNVIRKLSLDSLGGPLTEGPGFPFTTMKWNLCATQPALTDMHYDAGKVATWVHILRGTKIWFVLDGELPQKGLVRTRPKDLKFIYYVLEEGSIFTMPPGTVHAVLNVTDCFAEGGHMFLRHALHRSFNIGLQEHLKGLQDTNTNHTQAEAALHGIWTHFYTLIVHNHAWIKGSLLNQELETGRDEITYASLRENNRSLPPTEDMVSLICMCVHAMAFEPQVNRNEQNQCPESLNNQRILSREKAEETIFWIEDLWGPLQENETQISENLQKSPFNIRSMGVEYIINPLIDPNKGRPTKHPISHLKTKKRGKGHKK